MWCYFLAIIVILLLLQKPKNRVRIKLSQGKRMYTNQKQKATAVVNGAIDVNSIAWSVTNRPDESVVVVEPIPGTMEAWIKPDRDLGDAVVSVQIAASNGELLGARVQVTVEELPATTLQIELSDPEPL